jgi:folate-binding protein YgfZ
LKLVLDLKRSYALIRSEACALESSREAVVVRGPDARGWIQGQVSQDIGSLGVGGSAETLLLSPQGKIDVYGRVTILGDDIVLLDTEAGHGQVLSDRLRRFRLRVKADLETATVRCLQVRGPAWAKGLADSGLELGTMREGAIPGELDDRWAVALPVSWPGYSGFDVLASAEAAETSRLVVPFGDPAAFEAARIEAGVPAMGRELTEKTIPQEAGDLVGHTVSFTKGCFTGQELVARLDARGGNVAWRLRGLVLASSNRARPGSTLSSADREVGRLTSVAWSPGFEAPVALGYVRRDVVPPASAEVGPEGGSAQIRELPLQIR